MINKEKFHSYMKGWSAGATFKALDPKFTQHATRLDLKEEYELGYRDGRKSRADVVKKASERIGYIPTVLRTATVCNTCNDTHKMKMEDRIVMCTFCPTPCNDCRVGGNGAYCTEIHCKCGCHAVVDDTNEQ